MTRRTMKRKTPERTTITRGYEKRDNLKKIYNNKNNKRDDDKDKNYKKSAYEEDNYMSNEKKSEIFWNRSIFVQNLPNILSKLFLLLNANNSCKMFWLLGNRKLGLPFY